MSLSFAHRTSANNRHRKWKRFLDRFKPSPQTSILDVGYSDEEFSPTDNYMEKFYPWPEQVTALGIEPPVQFRERYPAVKAVQYDGHRFPFEDRQFDICWSNAVIEHVGDRDRQLQFLKEVNRVSKRAFITTPNRHFPIEVHTRTPLLHWLPKPAFERYLRMVGKQWACGDYMRLLSLRDVKGLLREAGIGKYRIETSRLCLLPLEFVITWENA